MCLGGVRYIEGVVKMLVANETVDGAKRLTEQNKNFQVKVDQLQESLCGRVMYFIIVDCKLQSVL